MLMSTMSSLNISISIRRKLMLMSRLSSPTRKLFMLMFMLMLMLASQVKTALKCFSYMLMHLLMFSEDTADISLKCFLIG